MDPRIGILMREGRTIYYAFIKGVYVERHSLIDMEDAIRAREKPCCATT